MPHDVHRSQRIEKELLARDIRFEFRPGIYGQDVSDEEISETFDLYCSEYCRKSVIGCAMAHILLWREIAEGSEEHVIILEDDAKFSRDFSENIVYERVVEAGKFDILLLGCLHGCGNNDAFVVSHLYRRHDSHEVVPLSENIVKTGFFGGTQGYVLSRNGATKLLRHIEKEPVWNHIDLYMDSMGKRGLLDIKVVKSPLVTQSLTDTNNASYGYIDSVLARLFYMNQSIHPYYTNISSFSYYGIDWNVKNTVRILVLGLLMYALYLRKIQFAKVFVVITLLYVW